MASQWALAYQDSSGVPLPPVVESITSQDLGNRVELEEIEVDCAIVVNRSGGGVACLRRRPQTVSLHSTWHREQYHFREELVKE